MKPNWKEQREKRAFLALADGTVFHGYSVGYPADTAGEAETRELGRAVNGFIRGLPEREANILIRRCFYSEPVKQIARSYGLNEKHAAVILGRTRKKLRAYLIKEGFIDE